MKRALIAAALVAITVPVGLVVLTTMSGSEAPAAASQCTAGTVDIAAVDGLNAAQLAIAGTAIATGEAMAVPAAGWVVEIAAGLVESTLTNLDHGDRDSLGWLQQRPSQGWGTPAQIMDPAFASRSFYVKLLAVKGWQSMVPGDAAQAVQHSGFPDRYQVQVPLAQLVVSKVKPGSEATTPDCSPAAFVGAAGTDTVVSPLNAGGPMLRYQVPIPAGPAGQAMRAAFTQIGKPYNNQRGQFDYYTTPDPPYLDCSGLTMWAVWWGAHVKIAQNAAGQWATLPHVAWAARQPGDLVMYEGLPPGHVAMFLGTFAGPDGVVRDYQIAATTFGQPLRIQPVWSPRTGLARWTGAVS